MMTVSMIMTVIEIVAKNEMMLNVLVMLIARQPRITMHRLQMLVAISRTQMVPRQFVYGHFVYDTSSTDNSSTTVYQGTGQIYIQLLFQKIIIFINSNFYLHYESLYQSNFH